MVLNPNLTRKSTTALLAPTLLVATFALSSFAAGSPAAPEGPVATALSTDSIVQKLVVANAQRARALRGYQQTRSYSLNYHGFPGSRSAEMKVDAFFTAPNKKDFTVVSQSGSKFLLTHVLLKLLDSEKEAWQSGKQLELTPDNYEFTFLQMDRTPEGEAYVLQVKPRINNKFLYKGKIWVDAHDFAVTRLSAEPARNPSFWISRTQIDLHYAKFGEFWLPLHNNSVTHVRLGGDAVLNIDYADYQINGTKQARDAHPSDQTPVLPPANSVSGDPH
jgi:hypothetical protein